MPCKAKITITDSDGWRTPEIDIIHCNQQDDHTGDHTATWYEAGIRWTQ